MTDDKQNLEMDGKKRRTIGIEGATKKRVKTECQKTGRLLGWIYKGKGMNGKKEATGD